MPIYRLSLQEINGLVIADKTADAIRKLETVPGVIEAIEIAEQVHGLRPQRCAAGLIKITPPYWRADTAEHYMEIGANQETALYRRVPQGTFDSLRDLLGRGGLTSIVDDSNPTIKIPGNKPAAYLLGPIKGDSRPRLHELIFSSKKQPPRP